MELLSFRCVLYSLGRLSPVLCPRKLSWITEGHESRKEGLALFCAGGCPLHYADRCLLSALSRYKQLGGKRADVRTWAGGSGHPSSPPGKLRLSRLGFRAVAVLACRNFAAHPRDIHCGHSLAAPRLCGPGASLYTGRQPHCAPCETAEKHADLSGDFAASGLRRRIWLARLCSTAAHPAIRLDRWFARAWHCLGPVAHANLLRHARISRSSVPRAIRDDPH